MKALKTVAAILLATALTGCTFSVNGSRTSFSDKPSIGPTVEKRLSREIKIDKQSLVNLNIADGDVKISAWDKDYADITIVSKLTGPSSKKDLGNLIEQYPVEVKSAASSLDISVKQPDKKKMLSSFNTDVEICLPDKISDITIKGESGSIDVSGFKKTSLISLTLSSGSIILNNCKVNRSDIVLDKGEVTESNIEGNTSIKTGYADLSLAGLKGDLELHSSSGNTVIDRTVGKLICDISEGSIDMSGVYLKDGTSVFATNGDIVVKPDGMDSFGTVSFRAANGSIGLTLPQNLNFILDSKIGNGIIKSNINLAPPKYSSGQAIKFNPLKKEGSGMQLYGRVGDGGPSVIIYATSGEITVNQNKQH